MSNIPRTIQVPIIEHFDPEAEGRVEPRPLAYFIEKYKEKESTLEREA